MTDFAEFFISVDIETAGPNPSDYALLAIGACTINEPRDTFYIECQPDKAKFTEEALSVSQLDLDQLQKEGSHPKMALTKFANWIERVTPAHTTPIFIALNAPYDWMFINDYFHHYLGYNPFGHKALDIKALYMGRNQSSWAKPSYRYMVKRYGLELPLSHHALEDAIQQAKIFQSLLREFGGNDNV